MLRDMGGLGVRVCGSLGGLGFRGLGFKVLTFEGSFVLSFLGLKLRDVGDIWNAVQRL